jgi:hypothetical protein
MVFAAELARDQSGFGQYARHHSVLARLQRQRWLDPT